MMTNAANATLLGNTAPIWVSLAAVSLLNEPISWAQVAGGALVLAGNWFVNRPREAKP
jgi:drug/metabolite transporter (DMT)-like permease